MALPVAEKEIVAPAVVRVEGRVGHLAVVIARAADEEIEVAVAVHVREREGARRPGRDDAGGGRDLLERAVPAIPEEARRAEGVRHGEIRIAVAVDVACRHTGRGDARCRPARREPRAHGHVREVSLAVVPVEDRPHAVAHEEVLGAVPVEVQNGHARARPDAVDEPVRELLRRIAARRAEARREGRVVEAGMSFDSVWFGGEKRDREGRGRRRGREIFFERKRGGAGRVDAVGASASGSTNATLAARSTRAPSARKPSIVNTAVPRNSHSSKKSFSFSFFLSISGFPSHIE